MDFVYYGNAFTYFEVGRTEMLRSSGVPYRELEARGVYLPVTWTEARFRRPARYDDRLRIRTRLVSLGRVRMTFEYEIDRESDRVRIVEGASELVCTTREGKPRRLPQDVLEAARPLLEASRFPRTGRGGGHKKVGAGRV